MIEPPIISAETDQEITKARQLADELGLEFAEQPNTDRDYSLVVGKQYLSIKDLTSPKEKPFYIDFLSGKLRYRWQQAGSQKELLARALGAKPKDEPTIIDATAGLGRDSFILAALGFKVTSLERSTAVYALLRDALQRASQDIQTKEIAERITLIHTDANSWLNEQTQKVQIIYLDPMFPAREKSAKVKKEMVILQNLLGEDADTNQLFKTAIACASKRVVVKRPRLAPTISEKAPSYSLKGTSSRFDIYTV